MTASKVTATGERPRDKHDSINQEEEHKEHNHLQLTASCLCFGLLFFFFFTTAGYLRKLFVSQVSVCCLEGVCEEEVLMSDLVYKI